MLARLHIARSDPTYAVRNAASHIWKIVVVNTPRTLRELMPVLVQQLLASLGSTLREHQQVLSMLYSFLLELSRLVLPSLLWRSNCFSYLKIILLKEIRTINVSLEIMHRSLKMNALSTVLRVIHVDQELKVLGVLSATDKSGFSSF